MSWHRPSGLRDCCWTKPNHQVSGGSKKCWNKYSVLDYARNLYTVTLTESLLQNVPVATSLNRPGSNTELVARYLNLTEPPLKSSTGPTIKTVTVVGTNQMDNWLLRARSQRARVDLNSDRSDMVQKQLQLYSAFKGRCKRSAGSWIFVTLVARYITLFSSGSGDVGRAALVEHSDPILEGTRAIYMPHHSLGQGKPCAWTIVERNSRAFQCFL